MRITDADIALAERLADAAGAAIRPYFRASFDVETKDDQSPVTIADRAAEQAMRALLAAEAPRDGIAGEEFGTSEGSTGRQWVLDPIDGTVSFIAGRPDIRHVDRAAAGRLAGDRHDRPADRRRALGRRVGATDAVQRPARRDADVPRPQPTRRSRPAARTILAITNAERSMASRRQVRAPTHSLRRRLLQLRTASRAAISIWWSKQGSSSTISPRWCQWSRARAGGCATGRATR